MHRCWAVVTVDSLAPATVAVACRLLVVRLLCLGMAAAAASYDSRRAGICRPQMFGKKCDASVIAEILVTRPVLGAELHKGQPLSPVKHSAGYRPGSAEILGILVSLRGRRGHALGLLPQESNCQRGHLALSSVQASGTFTDNKGPGPPLFDCRDRSRDLQSPPQTFCLLSRGMGE
jgi:hypothetical protein